MTEAGRPPRSRVLLAVLVVLLPVVAVSLSPWNPATGFVLIGLLPTLSAVPSGPRAMVSAVVGAATVAFVVVLVGGTGQAVPLLGTAAVAGLGLATGSLSIRGLHPVGSAAIVLAAYLLVDPRSTVGFLTAEATLPGAAAVIACTVLLVGLWAVGVVAILLKGVRIPVTVQQATLPYGVLLAIVCGVFMLICLLWFRGTNSWWAVMTVALVLQPTQDETRARLHGRILGTVLGGVVVAVLVVLVSWEGALVVAGLVASVGSVGFMLSGAAYWRYTAAVTMSVILLTFDGDSTIAGDVQRILVTVIAGLGTALAVSVAATSVPLNPEPSADR